jgi:hypothetical protein
METAADVARSPEPIDGLEFLNPLVGDWRGHSKGVFGTADVSRRAEFVLRGRFLRVSTTSISEQEVHEDIGFFSYDAARDVVVLREFHNEGYVNRYIAVADEDGRLVFESEHIENPYDPTLRARLVIQPGESLIESLELATGDKPFVACVELRLRRTA